jgi:hypothetical protein
MKLRMVLIMFTLGVMLNMPNAVYGMTTIQDTSQGYSCAQDDDVAVIDTTAVVSISVEYIVPSVDYSIEVCTAKYLVGTYSTSLSLNLSSCYGIYDDYGERNTVALTGHPNKLKQPPSGTLVYRRSRDGLMQS